MNCRPRSIVVSARTIVPARTGRNASPRYIVIKPTEGNVHFEVSEPYDTVLEPLLDPGQAIRFGYYNVDCDLSSAGPRARTYVKVCRPFEVRIGTAVLMNADATRRQRSQRTAWLVLALAFTIGVGVWGVSTRRRL